MISTDRIGSANPIFSGPAELQTGAPFQSSSLNGATVFSLSGNNGSASQVTVGRITFDVNHQIVAEFDENTGGAVTTGNVLTGAYAVQINGRGTLDLDSSNSLTREWLVSTISPNRAFIMDGLTADVGMGEVNPQLTMPPFVSSDIVGTYVLGSGEPLVSAATLYSGSSNFDGSGMMNGSEDINYASSLSPSQSLTGTYSVSSSPNNGRGVLLLTSPNTETIVLWILDESDVLGLGIDSSNVQPTLLHLEQ